MDVDCCIFANVLSTCERQTSNLILASQNAINKIIDSSYKRTDNFNSHIESELRYHYHMNCYRAYTSGDHITRFLRKRKSSNNDNDCPSTTKISKRSDSSIFDFKVHCFICGKICNPTEDKKHPDRMKNKWYVYKGVHRGSNFPTLKEKLLNICKNRMDTLANDVLIRISGAPSDLKAVQARYHVNCLQQFYKTKPQMFTEKDAKIDNDAITSIVQTIKANPDRTWTSHEIHKLYLNNGDINNSTISNTSLLAKISEIMKDEISIFKSPGLSSILMLKKKAFDTFKVVSNLDEIEQEQLFLQKIAKNITKECQQLFYEKDFYSRPLINEENLHEDCSPTLSSLLALISPKLSNTLTAALIGNIITSCVSSRTTNLQLALGILVHKKKNINILNKFGVTTPYHEVRRFKISAAKHVKECKNITGFKAENGLVQVIADNFDLKISSQNCQKQTHALASIVIQKDNVDLQPLNRISKIKHSSLNFTNDDLVSLKVFNGTKNPPMPEPFYLHKVLPLSLLCQQKILVDHSLNEDFKFIKMLTESDDVSDFNGFCTKEARKKGIYAKKKTLIRYQPLIDHTPTDPSTIYTAMVQAEEATQAAGQEYTVFTVDQDLYKIVLDIMWCNTERWLTFIPRLGGMHWLMSFIGAIGTLMKSSGLVELMKSAFSSVERMLTGKHFPMNMRALRLTAIEIIRDYIGENIENKDDFQKQLNVLSQKSILAKHWINNLIRPVFIMMIYVRAEHEGEFALHLYACKKMIPYFFASNHFNYARYGLCYLRSMENLPGIVLKKFMQGEHVTRLKNGICNGIWSDMLIEMTYMKYGKGDTGCVGISSNPSAQSVWSKTKHICAETVDSLSELCDLHLGNNVNEMKHKEESPARINNDIKDRLKIRHFLTTCLHPFSNNDNPEKLINIYNGYISEKVNVHESVEKGLEQMTNFQSGLPESFKMTLSNCIKTMSHEKSGKKEKHTNNINPEMIFSRILYLVGEQKIDLNETFNYELSPVVSSLFRENGNPRYPNNKSELKSCLKVVSKSRSNQASLDHVIIDGCAILHSSIYWPKYGKVYDLQKNVTTYIQKLLVQSNVNIVFDRYRDYSIKSDTRKQRISQFQRNFVLNESSPLPPKDIAMGSIKTKKQIIEIVSKGLFEYYKNYPMLNSLIITSDDDFPKEIRNGIGMKRNDMQTKHEEADLIIVSQVSTAIREGKNCIKVISDDTDVFVLLCNFYHRCNWSINLLMEESCRDKEVISINNVVNVHEHLMNDLLAMHALTGCDTVPMMFGIGKKTAISALSKSSLKSFSKDSFDETVLQDAKCYISMCYGVPGYTNMNILRSFLWKRKTTTNKLTSSSKSLCTLPATDEALNLNISRAFYQYKLWESSLWSEPPKLDPCQYGWVKDINTKTLQPLMLPIDVKIAPDYILKSMICNCKTTNCINMKCSCKKANLPCTEFCGCKKEHCENQRILEESPQLENESDYSSDDEDNSS